MPNRCLLVPLLALLAANGCMVARAGLTPRGLNEPVHGYEVSFADAAAMRFLSENWRLDNFYLSEWSKAYVPKDFPPYVTTFEFDTDGDGKANTTDKLSTYDLRFENNRTQGVIWLRAIPLATYEKDKELRGLMRDWIDAWAGTAVAFFRADDQLVTTSKSLATKLTSEAPATLAGLEAYTSTYDVALTEQLKLDPNARTRRVKVVMVRSGLVHKIGLNNTYPVLLVAGVSDMPEHFEQSATDFDQFLNLVGIADRSGFKQQSPAASTESVSPAPVPLSTPPTPEQEPASTPQSVPAP